MFKLKYEDGHRPSIQTLHSTGADLTAREEVKIGKGETAIIPVGVWIESNTSTEMNVRGYFWDEKEGREKAATISYRYDLQVRPRSGLATKGILGHFGTIDIDYRNEIGVILVNTTNKEFVVTKGMRVGQLVLGWTSGIPGVELLNTERNGGFGSSGT